MTARLSSKLARHAARLWQVVAVLAMLVALLPASVTPVQALPTGR